MTGLVVDASVAFKWFCAGSREPLLGEAHDLLDGYTAGRLRIFVPDLFWAESANIFWKAVRQGRWKLADAEKAIGELTRLRFSVLASSDLIEDAFAVAAGHGRTVYDSLYVAAAAAC